MAKKKPKTTPKATSQSASRPLLDAEFAHRLRDPFEQPYLGILRTNDPLLLERGHGGVQLYLDLLRDGKVFSSLQKRQLALVGKEWQVLPLERKDARAVADAKVASEILQGFAFDKLCLELLQALVAGWAVAEIVWTHQDGRIVPQRIINRAQRRFVFVQPDADTPAQLHLITRENMLVGEAVPPKKFIVHAVNAQDDNPYGTGLGQQLFWPVFFKRKGVVAWNKLCDRFGSPTPHGKYPRSASPQEKNTLVDALRAMSNDGYLATPEGMEISLLETRLSGNVTTQQQLCEYMDNWIAEVLTGQEPARNGGGALAAAAIERQNVRQDLTQADSDLLSETLNQTLMAWICEFNGLAPCGVFRKVQEEADLKAQAEADTLVASMGYELEASALTARYGEGWKKREASILPASFAQPATSTSTNAPTSAPAVPTDTIDRAIAEELQHWQPLLAPMVDPLQALLHEAHRQGFTAQQVLEQLPQALARMDSSALTAALTRLMFAAAASETVADPATATSTEALA